MASDPRSLQRLARITSEVDRVAGRETARRLDELERRLAALERSGVRPAGSDVDAIRVRGIEGRAADAEVALRGVREEVREQKLRVEAVSTETSARLNTTQMALQEVRRLLEERAAPLKMLEVEMTRQAARTEEARNELRRWMEGAEPLLLKAAEAVEVLGPDAAAHVQRLPEVLQGLASLLERMQRVEQATGQVAAQAEGLVKAGEEAAGLLEDLKVWKGGPSPRGLEERLAVLEKEAGRWEDLGEVLLTLREGLGAVQKEAAKLEGLQEKTELLDAHAKELQHLAGVADELQKEVRRGPALPPDVQRIPALAEKVARLEREGERFAELGEVLLKLREGFGGLQKEAARLEGLERRTGLLEAHGKEVGGIGETVEGLLREVAALRAPPPEMARLPEVEKQLGEHERTLQRFAGIAEEVLKGMETMDEQRKGLAGALEALRESPVEKRLQEVELSQAKLSGAVEHLLKQVDDLEAMIERVRRVVLQQSGPKAEG